MDFRGLRCALVESRVLKTGNRNSDTGACAQVTWLGGPQLGWISRDVLGPPADPRPGLLLSNRAAAVLSPSPRGGRCVCRSAALLPL